MYESLKMLKEQDIPDILALSSPSLLLWHENVGHSHLMCVAAFRSYVAQPPANPCFLLVKKTPGLTWYWREPAPAWKNCLVGGGGGRLMIIMMLEMCGNDIKCVELETVQYIALFSHFSQRSQPPLYDWYLCICICVLVVCLIYVCVC